MSFPTDIWTQDDSGRTDNPNLYLNENWGLSVARFITEGGVTFGSGNYPYTVERRKIDTGDSADNLYELLLKNSATNMPHTILVLENPSAYTSDHEATIAQIIKSTSRVVLHDSALMDYDGITGMFYVLKNFSDAEYFGWEWNSYARVGGRMTRRAVASLDGAGVFQPKGGYKSADGSAGATGSFTSADGKTVTVKNGIITAIV